MKSIILFLLIVGIVLVTNSNQKKLQENLKTEKIIEYRFIPRSIYDEQLQHQELTKSFVDMFEKEDVFINSPYR